MAWWFDGGRGDDDDDAYSVYATMSCLVIQIHSHFYNVIRRLFSVLYSVIKIILNPKQ